MKCVGYSLLQSVTMGSHVIHIIPLICIGDLESMKKTRGLSGPGSSDKCANFMSHVCNIGYVHIK